MLVSNHVRRINTRAHAYCEIYISLAIIFFHKKLSHRLMLGGYRHILVVGNIVCKEFIAT